MRAAVGHPVIQTHADPHGNSLCLESTEESFGICRLPDSLIEHFNMAKSDSTTASRHDKSADVVYAKQLSANIAIKLTDNMNNQYQYLAEKQGTKYAIVPAHTKAEVALSCKFAEKDNRFKTTRNPDWNLLVQL